MRACVCVRMFEPIGRERKKQQELIVTLSFSSLSVGLARSLSLPFISLSLALFSLSCRHADYADSAYIYVGGLDGRLTEGDVITIFSQVCLCACVCCVLGEFTCFLPSSIPPSNSLSLLLSPSLPSLHLSLSLAIALSRSLCLTHTQTPQFSNAHTVR